MSQNLFSDRLAEAMEKSGLRQSDLIRIAAEQGHKLGKSQLSQYLSGKVTPRAQAVVILAQALGVSEEWLAEGEVASQQDGSSMADVQSASCEDAGSEQDSGSKGTNAMRKGTAAGRQGEGSSMRQFTKSHKLDNVLYDIRGPVLDEAYRMEDQGIHVLKLNIGNPAPFGFRTPDEVVKDMQDQLTECEGYSNSRGLFAARKAIMQYDQLKGIPNVDVAREHQLVIFADEIYDRLVMDGKQHVSIASLAPDLFCITFNGLSKSHMVAGYRIGWMSLSGNKRIAKDLIDGINMLSNMRLCSNVPAQSIVQTCLGGIQRSQNLLVPGGRIFEQREYVYDRLSHMDGVTVTKPEAAFYIFPRLDPEKFHITDDDQFALDLLKDKHVLVTAGKGFNWETPGYFRVVYLPRKHTLHEAMDALEDFLSYYHQ